MRDTIAVSSRKLQETIAKERQNSSDDGAMAIGDRIGTGLEFIDLKASALSHIDISIYLRYLRSLVAFLLLSLEGGDK